MAVNPRAQLKALITEAIRAEPVRNEVSVALEVVRATGFRRAMWTTFTNEEKLTLVQEAIEEARHENNLPRDG